MCSKCVLHRSKNSKKTRETNSNNQQCRQPRKTKTEYQQCKAARPDTNNTQAKSSWANAAAAISSDPPNVGRVNEVDQGATSTTEKNQGLCSLQPGTARTWAVGCLLEPRKGSACRLWRHECASCYNAILDKTTHSTFVLVGQPPFSLMEAVPCSWISHEATDRLLTGKRVERLPIGK